MNILYFQSLFAVFALFYMACVVCMPLDDDDDNEISDVIDLSFLGPALFGLPSNKSGDRLAKWTPESGTNPEEQGEYLEGDILHPPSIGRNGIRSEAYRWKGGVIPYELADYFSPEDQNMIAAAMDDYHELTCIRFRPRSSSDRDYLWITKEHSGCWSSIGRIGGRQQLNLQSPGCLGQKGTPIHELMHAVGFTHEQNSPDRDNFVTILWNNIQPGRENNFQKGNPQEMTNFGVKYDYRSVMHYGCSAFGIGGKDTILPKKFLIFQTIDKKELGQRRGFSRSDVEKIRRMYNCRR